MKIVTIVGARPQFIKAATVSRVVEELPDVREVLVHTGQHYDENMSDIFFRELEIRKPHYHLGVGSASHAVQTGEMLRGIEEVLLKEQPDWVLVYGDTNSTLAGAIAAAKLRIPIVHIEAGLRSFNKSMPEEINRIMCDHASTLLFSPTTTGFDNLLREGFNEKNQQPYTSDNPGIFHCGDIMFDNSLFFAEIAEQKSRILNEWGLAKDNYLLATIHRDNNTDIPERLTQIFNALLTISTEHNLAIALPMHPRTAGLLKQNLNPELYQLITSSSLIRIMPPVSFLDMIALEKNARMVITDSGGVQKEAYFFSKPCVIVRPETEWVEIVEAGAGVIADADFHRIVAATGKFIEQPPADYPAVFGDGNAAGFMCRTMIACHSGLS